VWGGGGWRGDSLHVAPVGRDAGESPGGRRWRDLLDEHGKLDKEQSSVLIVICQLDDDTTDLEAQIRGSRYSWQVRVISLEALFKMVALKSATDDPASAKLLRGILIPREFTKLDALLDIVSFVAEDVSSDEEEEEEGGSGSGMIIAIIIILVLGVGGFFGWKYVYLPKKQKQELAAKQLAEAKEKAAADSIARANEAERLRLEAEAKNAKPAIGAIDTLAQRTGHYYVIISSAVDGDLVMDRAKKLSASGTSTKIIPPFGKWKYYRLGIGDFDSFASAQSSADASKAEYGDALWVMKF